MDEIVRIKGEASENPKFSTLLRQKIASVPFKRILKTLAKIGFLCSSILVVGAVLFAWGQRSFFLERRAASGEARAQYWLGRAKFNVASSQKQYLEAVTWLREAALQGHVPAETSLGIIYARGLGVQRNRSQALEWFQAAADNVKQSERSQTRLLRFVRSLRFFDEGVESWAVDLARKNLAVAEAAERKRPLQVQTREGVRYDNALIRVLTPEKVMLELLNRGNAGLAQVKRKSLPEDLARLCKYSEEKGVVPFSLWVQGERGVITVIGVPTRS